MLGRGRGLSHLHEVFVGSQEVVVDSVRGSHHHLDACLKLSFSIGNRPEAMSRVDNAAATAAAVTAAATAAAVTAAATAVGGL